jgi:hypothetical protein
MHSQKHSDPQFLSCFQRSTSLILKGAFQSMIPYVGRMWRSDGKGERKRGIALGFRLWRSDKKRERQRERERLHASASPFGPNTSSATTPITNTSGAPTPSNEACTPVFLTCVPFTTHTHGAKGSAIAGQHGRVQSSSEPFQRMLSRFFGLTELQTTQDRERG